jgi:hypothetical protein
MDLHYNGHEFLESCNFSAAKINVTAVAYFGCKVEEQKNKNKHPSAGDGSPARPA